MNTERRMPWRYPSTPAGCVRPMTCGAYCLCGEPYFEIGMLIGSIRILGKGGKGAKAHLFAQASETARALGLKGIEAVGDRS